MFSDLNFSKYPSRDKIKNELIQLQKHYPNFNVKMESCDRLQPSNSTAIKITLIIDIENKNGLLNIQLIFYLPDMYPLNKPIVFIKPPEGRSKITASNIIHHDGFLNTETIYNWNHFTSNIGLLSLEIKNWLSVNFPFSALVKSDSSMKKASSNDVNNPNTSSKLMDPKALREAAQNVVYGVHSSYSYPGSKSQPLSTSPTNFQTSFIKTNSANKPLIFNTNFIPSSPEEKLNYSAATKITSSNSMLQNIDDSTIQGYMKELKLETKRRTFVEKYNRHFLEISNYYNQNIDYLIKEAMELNDRGSLMFKLLQEYIFQTGCIVKNILNEMALNNILIEVQKNLQKQQNEGIPFDSVIDTTMPLYRQLLRLFLEDQTLEDTIFFLHVGLGKSMIDIDAFLKKVRELSRRQFILKATIEKCRKTAGLTSNS